MLIFQIWFQNRRAKFRRNESSMRANSNASTAATFNAFDHTFDQLLVQRVSIRSNNNKV